MNVLWIALAGGLGSVLRYVVTLLIPQRTENAFPVAILLVNVTGSLIAGITLGAVAVNALGLESAVIVWAGLCGGLTTFSTFAVDTVRLHRRHIAVAWRNIMLTVIFGIGAASLGFVLTLTLLPLAAG